MNLKERAQQLKVDIPTIFLCLKHPKTPWIAKILAACVVIYALSPIDLIPDFIPVIGYLDDLLILPGLILLTIHFIPKDLYRQLRLEAEGLWKDAKPKHWIYALPMVALWVLILVWLVKVLT